MPRHYKARVYDPILGRFLQTDPIGYQDDQNLYAYVYNDPVNARDPSGLCREAEQVECRERFGTRIPEAVRKDEPVSATIAGAASTTSDAVNTAISLDAALPGASSGAAQSGDGALARAFSRVGGAATAVRGALNVAAGNNEKGTEVVSGAAVDAAIGKGIEYVARFYRFPQPVAKATGDAASFLSGTAGFGERLAAPMLNAVLGPLQKGTKLRQTPSTAGCLKTRWSRVL